MTKPVAAGAFLVPEGEGRTSPLDLLGQRALVKLASADTGNAAAVFHLDAPPMSGPPLHRHSREDEWFLLLNGQIVVEVDGRRLTLNPGDSAFLPRGTVHAFQNFTSTSAQMLVMVTPAGFHQFFEDLSALNAGLAAPDLVGTERLMNAYGMEVLGPPLR